MSNALNPLQADLTTFNPPDLLTKRIAYDGTGNPEYVGQAEVGSLVTDAAWQIKKITYATGNPTVVAFAGGSLDFNKVWDDRATYTYS